MLIRGVLLTVLLLACAVPAPAQEKLNLTTPQVKPQITTSDYKVDYFGISRSRQLVVVELLGTNGEKRTYEWTALTTPSALSLMTTLNSANLSVKSLERRILELIATSDAALAGTVSGAAQ